MNKELLETLKNNEENLKIKLDDILQKYILKINKDWLQDEKKIKKESGAILLLALSVNYAIFFPLLYFISAPPLLISTIVLLILFWGTVLFYLPYSLGKEEKLRMLKLNEFKIAKENETLNKEDLILYLKPLKECFGVGFSGVIAEVMKKEEGKKELGSYHMMLNLYELAIKKEESYDDVNVYQKQVEALLNE